MHYSSLFSIFILCSTLSDSVHKKMTICVCKRMNFSESANEKLKFAAGYPWPHFGVFLRPKARMGNSLVCGARANAYFQFYGNLVEKSLRESIIFGNKYCGTKLDYFRF